MSSSARTIQGAAIGIGAIPVLVVLALTCRYAVNVPLHDEWDWSVRHVVDGDLPALRLGAFWALGNEHRVFVPTLLMAGIAHLTNLDMVVPLFVKIGFTMVILCVFARLYLRSADSSLRWLFVVPLSALLFSLAQWPRWIDVRPMPSTLSILGLAGTLVFLCGPRRTPRRFVFAALLATMSSLSYFSGNMTWVVAWWVLVLAGWPRRYWVAWIGLALCVLIPYAIDFSNSQSIARTAAPAAPVAMVEFVLAFLGSNMSSAPTDQPRQVQALLFGALGLFTFATLVWILGRDVDHGFHKALPWLAVAGWALLNAGAAAYGRAAMGGAAAARVPRYGVFCAQFWIAVAALAAIALMEPGRGRRRRFVGGFVAIAILLGFVDSSLGVVRSHRLRSLSQRLEEGRACLLLDSADDDEKLSYLYPSPEELRARIPALLRRRAAFLHGVAPLRLADATSEAPVADGLSAARRHGEEWIQSTAPFTLTWPVRCLDRPSVHLSLRWVVVSGGVEATAFVEDQGLRQRLKVEAMEAGQTRDWRLDLGSFRGREIRVVLGSTSTQPQSEVQLVGTKIIYTVEGER